MIAGTKVKKSKYIFLSLRIAVVICGVIWAILWFSRDQRWSKLVAIFRQMNMVFFAVALGVFIICQILVGLRWWLLLRTQSVSIDFWAAVRLHFLGLFYNNFMPSSVGGDLIRAWYVTRHTDKRFAAALSVFVDRAIGLLSTLIIAVFFYLLFLQGRGTLIAAGNTGSYLGFAAEHKWPILMIIMALAAIFCGLLLYKPGRVILKRTWLHACMHGLSIIKKLKDAIIIYCSKPLTILTVFGLTVILQISTITGFWLLGTDIGVDVSIKYYYVFFTLTWVLGAVPVSIGGAVVVEGSLAYLFVRFAGAQAEPAAALALCQRIVWMLASLSGAAIHLLGAHLPKEFFVDYQKPCD
ncbi:MAG: flippase-like domain-containing protein [Sedimentisphaerales bacterium]|nr:flippase-like domain-containing protein [Sedimentisphaerales bacterium]